MGIGEKMSRKIVITSGKGGVGKTTIACFLASKLAKLGKRVLVIDLDFNLNNLDVVCGVENKINYDLQDVVEGVCRVKQALVECERNFYILGSSRSFSSSVHGQNVKLLADGLSSAFDFIFFDCPAGVDNGFHRALACSDEAIVVINCYPTSLRDADKVLNILKSYKLKDVYLVANRVRRDLVSKGKTLSPEECEEILKTKLLGVIYEDDSVLISQSGIGNVSNSCQASFRLLAKNLIKMNDSKSMVYKKFFENFQEKFKKGVK